jgi:hypothetical protein
VRASFETLGTHTETLETVETLNPTVVYKSFIYTYIYIIETKPFEPFQGFQGFHGQVAALYGGKIDASHKGRNCCAGQESGHLDRFVGVQTISETDSAIIAFRHRPRRAGRLYIRHLFIPIEAQCGRCCPCRIGAFTKGAGTDTSGGSAPIWERIGAA